MIEIFLKFAVVLVPIAGWSFGVDNSDCNLANVERPHYQMKYNDSKHDSVIVMFGTIEACRNAKEILKSNGGVGEVCGCESDGYTEYLYCHSFDSNGHHVKKEINHWTDLDKNYDACEKARAEYLASPQKFKPQAPNSQAHP